MRVISPVILVRVGSIKDRALGNFCIDVDINQFIISQEKKDVRVLDLWYFEGPFSSNEVLTKLVKQNLIILPKFILAPIKKFLLSNNKFSTYLTPFYHGATGQILPKAAVPSIDFWQNYYCTSGLSKWLNKDTKEIESLKIMLGANSRKIVGIHIRDSEYKRHLGLNLGLDHSKVNYYEARSSYRDSDIINYINSATYLDDCGYKVIRLGRRMKSIPQRELDPIFDYAGSPIQNSYNDLHIINESTFVICSFSGIMDLARWHRKPIFAVDIGEFQMISRGAQGLISGTLIVLPKVVKYKSNGCVLTIEELKQLNIINLDSNAFREYINSKECPVFLEGNDPKALLETIKLGEKYLTTQKICEDVAAGKTYYQKMYSFPDFESAPILSPYWKNLYKHF